MANENVKIDVESYDVLTQALLDLVNEFPFLLGESIRFNSLKNDGGTAFFPLNGGVIERERKDVLGGKEQWCSYPFMIVSRAGNLTENRKKSTKEWLDDLGRWLEQQSVDGYRLESYPTLTGNRNFIEIRRTSPAYQMEISEDGSEDWAISINARYHNQYF